AGAAAGTRQTPRKNLLAYDITTGELRTSFVPGAFNGAVRALAVSADKKTLYVGGDFTRVGKTARGHFAALDASTGALRSAKPSFNKPVNALTANSKAVFAGGSFTKVNGKARSRLAAVAASSGKLTGWKAKANSAVDALVLTSGSKLLVVGGHFTKLNSTAASGSGAVSPTNGKTKTWKVNKVVKNGGKSSAILSLATDGDTVYGAGYTYGTGNFEGVYAASSKDGTLRWLQDCHGDTYGVAPIGDVVYSVGHAHYCSNIGGFPDTQPRTAWYRAMAVTKAAVGTVAKNGQTSVKTYTNFQGKPAPALVNWFPHLSAGTYTGMSQAAWSVVGNGTYISLGGEFPNVNGTPQQGLVRMAVARVAPNEIGPTGGAKGLALAARAQSDGRVTLEWGQLWDRDDLTLTYRLSRNGVVVLTRTTSVPFWQRSKMSFIDAGASSDGSSTLSYQVAVSDSSGNTVTSSTVRVDRPSTHPGDDDPPPGPSPVPSAPSPTSSPTSVPSATPLPTAVPSATAAPDVSQ
ncbi:MAG TPA: hypothetical protein PKE42_13300, partial [Arachnia sp.]|nr:hypothetical protein [Arachnia sp.]